MKLEKFSDFYIESGEQQLVKSILPEYYADNNPESLDADYAARLLQNGLNAVLNSFVNGGFSYRGFILYPLVRDVSKENLGRLMRLKRIAAFLGENGYDFSASIGSYNKGIKSSLDFAAALSKLYGDFSRIKSRNTKPAAKPECKELVFNDYKKSDLAYLKPLNGLKAYARKSLKQYLSGFYLHGSLATKDYVKGWSDVDTLAIISRKTIENPEKLLELRSKMYLMRHFFYKIDPLQHHGSIVISEYDLQSYCQAYFPVTIFRHAKSFFDGDRAAVFRARDYSGEALAEMFWFVSYFRKLYSEREYNMGSYNLKILLHSITLFPSLYLQAKGILGYKKFSFDIAKKDFKKENWKIIDDVSLLRRNWKSPKTMPLVDLYSGINPLLSYQLSSRFMDIFNGIAKSNNISIKSLVEGMHNLSEEAWGRVKQHAKKRI